MAHTLYSKGQEDMLETIAERWSRLGGAQ
jgi:hypothetical protein